MKNVAFILLSTVLFSTSCKKDTIADNNIDLNEKTNFTVSEEKEYQYTFSETPTIAVATPAYAPEGGLACFCWYSCGLSRTNGSRLQTSPALTIEPFKNTIHSR